MSATIFAARVCRSGGHLRFFELSRIANHNVSDPRDGRYRHRHGQIILNLGRVAQLWVEKLYRK